MMKTTGPTPEAVRAFRERQGWTHEQLAEEVWASPLEVAAWEAGTVRVPPGQAVYIRSVDQLHRRREAMDAALSPLPRCAWAAEHAPGLADMLATDPDDFSSRVDRRTHRHMDGCATCGRMCELASELVHVRADPALGSSPGEAAAHWFETTPRLILVPVVIIVPLMLLILGTMIVDRIPWPRIEGDWVDPLGAAGWGLVGFLFVRTCFRRSGALRDWPYLQWLLEGVGGVLAALVAWDAMNSGAFSNLQMLAMIVLMAVLSALEMKWARRAEAEAEAGQADEDNGGEPVLLQGTPVPAADGLSSAQTETVPGRVRRG